MSLTMQQKTTCKPTFMVFHNSREHFVSVRHTGTAIHGQNLNGISLAS